MRFMNEYEIEGLLRRYDTHPVMWPASVTLANLVTWTNSNSDGWAYWPKPARAAARLMEMMEAHDQWERSEYRHPREGAEATVAAYKKALSPIKAFRTRQNATFTVMEVIK